MAIQDIRAYSHLTDEDIEEIGRRLDAIERKHRDSLGERDAAYIHTLVRLQRSLDLGARVATIAHPAFRLPAGAVLGLAKILENLEIGHNVMHGQWDWMNDPEIHSSTWEWDNSGPSSGWKHTHNVNHHTYTNILGMDSDVGYGTLRVTRDKPWTPATALQPVTNVLLASLFQYAVAFYDVELVKFFKGRQSWEETRPKLAETLRKVGSQMGKDYIAFPLVAGVVAGAVAGVRGRKRAGRGGGRKGAAGKVARGLMRLVGKKGSLRDDAIHAGIHAATRAGQAAVMANLIRNVWAYACIFCGHFPDDVETFTKRTLEQESKAEWYLRQMLGSANYRGGKVLSVLSGNLNYQIEHHLFPDMPSNHLAEIGREVEQIADEFGLPYNVDSFPAQFLQVQKTILKLTLPNSLLRAEKDNAPEVRADAVWEKHPEVARSTGNRQLREGLARLKALRPRVLA